MATTVINTPDTIEFRTSKPEAPKNPVPYVTIQLGNWELGYGDDLGIVIDAGGDAAYPPVLSATDARKLAKWLNKAADELEGIDGKKSHKKKHYTAEEDEDETGGYKF